MNNKKYIATVMKKKCISDDNYEFIYSHVVFGDYDKDKKIFTDEYGNEYYYMMSANALVKDSPAAAYHILELEKLSEILNKDKKSFKELVMEYTNQIKDIIYFIGYTNDYTPYLSSINLAEIRRQANTIHETGKPEHVPVLDKLEKLMLDALDGKYTIAELKQMIETLTEVKDTIENTIGTMETKIGSLEENKPYVEYLNEQLNKPMDVVPPKTKELPEPKKEPEKQLETPKEGTDTSKLKEDLKKKYKVEEKKKEETVLIKKTKPEDIIDIDDLYNKVTKTLIAQDEPARRVIVELARKELEPSKKREAILLTGPTGVGKTELMRLISTHLNKALLIVDSTQITTAGYVGKDITEILWDLYVKCGKNKERAEHAIIYFDEIDKKGSEKNDDVNGKGVLNALLPFIEGTVYDAALDSKSTTQIVKLDTSNMTVILGGAFSDMYKHLIKKNEIGFTTEKNSNDTPEYRKAEIKDFVDYGMMTYEFMGRVVPIKLNDLGKNDIKRVVLESNQSALRKQESIFKKLGVKLTYTSEYIDKIVDKAFSLKTGARALNGIIDESTWRAFDYIYTHQGEYTAVLLDDKTVEDSNSYKLMKKKNKK